MRLLPQTVRSHVIFRPAPPRLVHPAYVHPVSPHPRKQTALHRIQMPVVAEHLVKGMRPEKFRVPAEKTFVHGLAFRGPGIIPLPGLGKRFSVPYL